MDEPTVGERPIDHQPHVETPNPRPDGEQTDSTVPELDQGPAPQDDGVGSAAGESPWDLERRIDDQRRI